MPVRSEVHLAPVGHSGSPHRAHIPPASIVKTTASRAPLATSAQGLGSHRALGKLPCRTHTPSGARGTASHVALGTASHVIHGTASHVALAIKAPQSTPERQASSPLSVEGPLPGGLGAGVRAHKTGALGPGVGEARGLTHPLIRGLRIAMSARCVALQVTKRSGRRPPQMTNIAPLSVTRISQMSSITSSLTSMSLIER